ncbi:MAG: PDK/BCKDK family protein kinase [Acidobacteriota bacterium]
MNVSTPTQFREKIRFLAQFKQRPLTLRQIYEFGLKRSAEILLQEAQFLHQELRVRLAHRVRDLETLPFGLSEMPSVQLLREMYSGSLMDLVEFPRPESNRDEERFTELLENIKQRHNNVVSIMSRGILELKEMLGPDALQPEIREFLDRFYLSRIGIRMLIGQHLALHAEPRPGYVGLICSKCCPAEVLEEATRNAQSLCDFHYGASPSVRVMGNVALTFTYIPSHLHHMLFELLKNSMRAVVELNGADSPSLPEIRVAIARGQEDVTIKISDEGGGIPRSGVARIWTYLYTTARPTTIELNSPYQSDFHAPMAGLGYGLPISRLYARYFGGDLQVISMEGFGTDAYLHLKRLGDEKEVVPRTLH